MRTSSAAHLGDALSRKSTTYAFHDAKHLCKDHLDTWARLEGKTTNKPHRPAAAPMLETLNPRRRRRRTLSTRRTYTQTHPDTWNTEEKR